MLISVLGMLWAGLSDILHTTLKYGQFSNQHSLKTKLKKVLEAKPTFSLLISSINKTLGTKHRKLSTTWLLNKC